MKTNVIMKSDDRNLFGAVIRQETGTGFMNLSDLQDVYNDKRIARGWSEKRIDLLLTHKSENQERVYYVLKEQGVINVQFCTFMEDIENQGGFFKYLKKIGQYKTTGARQTKTSWINPYLWILCALELSPEFYAKTVTWLTDKLILNRIEAGNMYNGLTHAISKFDNVDYVKLAKALNWIVFDKHETGIRNFANQAQLKKLEQLERQMAFSIDMGYIKSFHQLVADLRNIYCREHPKQLL
jgi:hypothetical protein